MKNMKIEFSKLVDYIEEQLDPDEYSRIEKQIENDPALKNMIAVIKALKSEAREADWIQMKKPSHDLFDRLFEDIKKRNCGPGKKYGVNIFDSGLLPIPEGIRPAEVETRRLKYLVGDGDIEMSLYPISPKSFELIGQINGIEQGRSISVELVRGRRRIAAKTNEFYLFRIPKISSGHYSLRIFEGDSTIGELQLEI